MTAATVAKPDSLKSPRGSQDPSKADLVQLVTFKVADVPLAIEICSVREINQLVDVTPVPDAPAAIHGVINLRGEVVTVINAHHILGVAVADLPKRGRNLILNLDGEAIGMIVDSVADIIEVPKSALQRCPANIRGIERTFVQAVHLSEAGAIVVIDSAALLSAINASAPQ